jgi:hypothetical protein
MSKEKKDFGVESFRKDFISMVKLYCRNKNVDVIELGGYKFINPENNLTDEIKRCYLTGENNVTFVIENLLINTEYNVNLSDMNDGTLMVLYGQILMNARTYRIKKYDKMKLSDGTEIYTIDTIHNECPDLAENDVVILVGDKDYRITTLEPFKRLMNDLNNEEVKGDMVSVTLKETKIEYID